MKSLITTLLTIGLIAPATTYAFSLSDIMEAAKAGNGTYIESSSSVSTGGQHASGGESVHTGDVSASSHVETHINAGSNGGSVHVKTETSENGNIKTEEYTKDLGDDEAVKVESHAESKNGEYKAEVKVNDEVMETEDESDTSESSQAAAANVAVESKISLLFTSRIPNFFKKVFSFAWWS